MCFLPSCFLASSLSCLLASSLPCPLPTSIDAGPPASRMNLRGNGCFQSRARATPAHRVDAQCLLRVHCRLALQPHSSHTPLAALAALAALLRAGQCLPLPAPSCNSLLQLPPRPGHPRRQALRESDVRGRGKFRSETNPKPARPRPRSAPLALKPPSDHRPCARGGAGALRSAELRGKRGARWLLEFRCWDAPSCGETGCFDVALNAASCGEVANGRGLG